MKITDITGRLLLEKTINATGTKIDTYIDISSLSAGIYFIQLETREKKLTDKLIKL